MKNPSILLFLFFLTMQGFSQNDSKNSEQKSRNLQHSKDFNKIAINPLGFFIGDYSIFYERMLGSTFSVEACIGITYQNYMYNEINSPSNNTNYDVKYQPGNTYSFSTKAYLNEDEFKGLYLSLYFRHRLYNSIAEGNNIGTFSEPLNQYYKIDAVTFNIGCNHRFAKNFIFDYYLGVGMKNTITSQAEYVMNSMNVTQITKSNTTMPTAVCGIKLGYAF